MDKYITKSSYYVEYLGWKPAKGIQGRIYTEPIIRELLERKKRGSPPKITIQLNKKEMKVSRETIDDGKKRKIKCIKYPPIPTRDIVFATQALEPNCEVVACVFLGYNPRTKRYVHAHVYRFDSDKTAANFVHYIQTIASNPDNVKRVQKVERDLIAKGQIDAPVTERESSAHETSSDSYGYHSENSGDSNGSASRDTDFIEDDLVSLHDVAPYDSVTDELKQRLAMGAAPLLLPPKDYDTISRSRGNTSEIPRRKVLSEEIVGVSTPVYRSDSRRSRDISDNDNGSASYRSPSTSEPLHAVAEKSPDRNESPLTPSYIIPNIPNQHITAPISPLVSSHAVVSPRISGPDAVYRSPKNSTSGRASPSLSSSEAASPRPASTGGLSPRVSMLLNPLSPPTGATPGTTPSEASSPLRRHKSTSSGNSYRSSGSANDVSLSPQWDPMVTGQQSPVIQPAHVEYTARLVNNLPSPDTSLPGPVSARSPRDPYTTRPIKNIRAEIEERIKRNPSIKNNINNNMSSGHNVVCRSPAVIVEPAADYDDISRVPSWSSEQNIGHQPQTNNIFQHDFYKNNNKNNNNLQANRVSVGGERYFGLQHDRTAKLANPLRRVNSYR